MLFTEEATTTQGSNTIIYDFTGTPIEATTCMYATSTHTGLCSNVLLTRCIWGEYDVVMHFGCDSSSSVTRGNHFNTAFGTLTYSCLQIFCRTEHVSCVVLCTLCLLFRVLHSRC